MRDTDTATDALFLPVSTTMGIAYASIPVGMSPEYFDHMMEVLEFYANRHPDFIHRPVPADYQI